MAKATIPNPMERRHLLERDMDAAQAIAYADAYIAEGRTIEALAFLSKAEATDRLEALVEEAVESGDAFLLRSIVSAGGGGGLDSRSWETLARAAEASGKTRYAELAQGLADPARAPSTSGGSGGSDED